MGKLSSLLRAAGHKKRFNSAVILAAGSGKRFSDDTAKQFVEIAGESILVRSAKAFQASEEVDEIVVVTRETDVIGCRNILERAGVAKVTRVIGGGDTRQASAKRGFDAVNPAAEYVAIHDAARCLITPEMIEAVFECAYVSSAAAAASRNPDTIKRTDGNDLVKETIDRENTWLVQTPQIFKADIYRAAAYMGERDAVTATDDCALCERLGFPVRLVDCGPTNIKITYPDDVVIAEAILKSREAAT
ncbi:MAG: 2-C-methyl-D-erythritol 4-phosphate cytidylyltransferase [Clostridia bacterium]|nr:2-C-methyl-D-erythritol 4-phosphate cytidylyltransferase [Clostridia bacterium]